MKKMKSKFIGFWSGIVEGSYNGKALVHIKDLDSFLEGRVILHSDSGHADLVTLRGEETDKNESKFKLINYISGGIDVVTPRDGNVILTFQEDSNEIQGEWSTDIGTSGKLTIRQARAWDKLKLLVPISIAKFYLELIRLLNLCNVYFAFVIILVLLSLFGYISKPNIIEGIILLIPILYFYRFVIRNVLIDLGIKKAGPLEFFEQSANPYVPQYNEMIANLRNRFGDEKFTNLLYLNRFFVPRTKLLLQSISISNQPITLQEFAKEANRLNIPDYNIITTLQALINTGCLILDRETGNITVNDYGREFLQFESVISRFTS